MGPRGGERTERLELRLTPEERAVIGDSAAAEGLSLADWLRAAALERARRIRRDVVSAERSAK